MTYLKKALFTTLVILASPAILANDLVLYDMTKKDPFTVNTQYPTYIENEGVDKLFDTSLQSKYISKYSQSWVSIQFERPKRVYEYVLTSALDAPKRDPKNWVLFGSNDGESWYELDKRNSITFSKRGQSLRFQVNDSLSFSRFKLDMKQEGTTAWGDSYLQLANFALISDTHLPIADFNVSQPVSTINQPIDIYANVANDPSKIIWSIPGATLFEAGNKAKAYFSKPGSYSVSLQAINTFGEDRVYRNNVIKVVDKSKPWVGHTTPKVKVVIEDSESAGAKRLLRLFPNIAQTIDRVTRDLAPLLYKNFAELPDFEQVTFTLKWMDTIAYRAGDDTNMEIAFSSKYITEKLAGKPDEDVRYELLGVLWHELTHGYQHFPKSVGYDDAGAHAFIEGMADLIRIQAGFHKTRSPKPSQSYLGGYTNTGFFLYWLSKEHDNFAYRFNKTAIELEKWRFDKAIKHVTGKDVDLLWSEYQQSLNSM
ncbi:basic secretory protein-like protein [Pseudoalteromonas aurantia]|uniref:PKD domain-containing protein n=1 Tax=Pseudoalteromonas aurantia TaxID=43654 RepID=A0ABY2VZ36_9GAMM|nr:basic secretory protein-like protein [Pseudoalteromonas aurantia]TMO60978.1 hypothetical protein CWC18_12185 [Pseudoalteromonas aurantia]TMO75710.1 hypothetical protein CWC20_07030 [Pseudoalteromonas aurantia]